MNIVTNLADYFFSKSTKVKPRTDALLKSIKAEIENGGNGFETKKYLELFCKKLERSSESGKLINSLDLNEMELKFYFYTAFKSRDVMFYFVSY